jgi:hypothetical protein
MYDACFKRIIHKKIVSTHLGGGVPPTLPYSHLQGSMCVMSLSKIISPVSPHVSHVCAYIPLIYLSQHLGQVMTSSLAKFSLDILVLHRRHDKVITYLPALLATIASICASCSGVALRNA